MVGAVVGKVDLSYEIIGLYGILFCLEFVFLVYGCFGYGALVRFYETLSRDIVVHGSNALIYEHIRTTSKLDA